MSVVVEKPNKRVITVNGVDQVFWYDDAEDLTEQLVKAQENATQKIADQAAELRQFRKTKVIESPAPAVAVPAAASFKAKDLSAEERHEIAMDLQNPERSADAVTRAIELGLGATIADIRRALNAGAELARHQEERNEGAKFRASNPDFMLYDGNVRMDIERDIVAWMKAKNCPFTAEWIQKAYEDLGANELLPPLPPKTEAQPGELPVSGKEANSSTRPRAAFSTSLRRETGTIVVPEPKHKDPVQLWNEIDNMTPEEYDRNMLNPNFRKMVNDNPHP